LLIDEWATLESVQSAIRVAAQGMGAGDLLTVSIAGHGTRRADESGDEEDGFDEGAVLFDGVWWDDDVWAFIQTLPPCRLDLYTDTCHAEGNWRFIGRMVTLGMACKREYVQLEFDFMADVRATPWAGRIVQAAGCREDKYSFGGKNGGTWTQMRDLTRMPWDSRTQWFERAAGLMPKTQVPVLATYGDVAEMLRGGAMW
jgi:hypothetical protein